MIGKTIGQYQVIDKIGEGGMGAVYKAEDTTLHRLVALKTLSTHLTEDEEAQERFVREAQSASSLNHPNITTVHEFIEDGDTRLICMEYVEGKTIRDMVESGVVSVRKAIDIIMQAAEALEAAHNKGILHRDVKSANIMVNMEGRVKVMDFGLAHLETRSQLTRTGTTMGTLSYSSPEQISGKPVDRRSEIFSLGVVFYELLTGQLPFRAANEAEILFAIINNEPPKLTKVRDDVPELVEAVVSRMLEKDVDLRYPTCGDVISDLKGIRMELETSTVGITGVLERVQVSRKKLMVQKLIAGVVVVAIIAAGIILLSTGSTNLDPNRVAVIEFENRTGDETLDQIASWAANWVSQGIDQTGLVDVVGFEAVQEASHEYVVKSMESTGSDRIRAVAEQTRAGIIIAGTLHLMEDNSIRFQVEIHDTLNKKILESLAPVIGSREESTELVQALRQRVMGCLASQLNPQFDSWVISTSKPPLYDAYIEFIEGLNYFFKNEHPRALPHFYRAASIDTSWLTPLVWAVRAHHGRDDTNQQAEADSIARIVNLSRDQLLPQARHQLDMVVFTLQGNLTAAYQEALKAMNLAPGTFWNYEAARYATFNNRPKEAVTYLSRIDPESPMLSDWYMVWSFLSIALHSLGDHQEELKQAIIAKERHPEQTEMLENEISALAALGRISDVNDRINEILSMPDIRSGTALAIRTYGDYMSRAAIELREHGYKDESIQLLNRAVRWYQNRTTQEKATLVYRRKFAATLYWAEQWDEAKAIYDELAVEFPENFGYLGALGRLAAQRGNSEEALRISNELAAIDLPYLYGTHTYQRASIAALLGDDDQAIALLQESFAQGRGYGGWSRLHNDPDFESIRNHIQFIELLRPKG